MTAMRTMTGAAVLAAAMVAGMAPADARTIDADVQVQHRWCTRGGYDMTRVVVDAPTGYGEWFQVMKNGTQVRLTQGIGLPHGRSAILGVRVRGEGVKTVRVYIRRTRGDEAAQVVSVRITSQC